MNLIPIEWIREEETMLNCSNKIELGIKLCDEKLRRIDNKLLDYQLLGPEFMIIVKEYQLMKTQKLRLEQDIRRITG
jgi:hypothetical protein